MNREEIWKMSFQEFLQAGFDKKLTLDEIEEWFVNESKCTVCEHRRLTPEGVFACVSPHDEDACRRARQCYKERLEQERLRQARQ